MAEIGVEMSLMIMIIRKNANVRKNSYLDRYGRTDSFNLLMRSIFMVCHFASEPALLFSIFYVFI